MSANKLLIIAIVATVLQIACVWWLIYSVLSLPIVEKVGSKVKREIVEWSGK